MVHPDLKSAMQLATGHHRTKSALQEYENDLINTDTMHEYFGRAFKLKKPDHDDFSDLLDACQDQEGRDRIFKGILAKQSYFSYFKAGFNIRNFDSQLEDLEPNEK